MEELRLTDFRTTDDGRRLENPKEAKRLRRLDNIRALLENEAPEKSSGFKNRSFCRARKRGRTSYPSEGAGKVRARALTLKTVDAACPCDRTSFPGLETPRSVSVPPVFEVLT